MRKLCAAVAALAAVALLVPATQAQGQNRPGNPGMAGMAMLFENKDVVKELKLSDDQVEKAKEIVKKIGESHKEDFAKLRDLAQDERRQKGQELLRQITTETLKDLGDTLKPEQSRRLKQLLLQQRAQSPFGGGVAIFLDAEVEKELKLTDKQKEDLKTMAEDQRKEAREIFQGAAGNFQEAGKKIRELNKEKMTNAESLLTADQKKAWKEMQGESFEFKFEPRRPRNQNQDK